MTLGEIRSIPAIDFHTHYGDCNVEERYRASVQSDMPGSIEFLQRNNRYAGIALSVVSHLTALLPRGGTDIRGNELCLEETRDLPGVCMFVVLNPLQKGSFEQTERILGEGKCLGIKIHPEEHCYPIKKYGGQIYEFAARHGADIITHSGEENSMPEDFCVFANSYPEVRTIISHMGCGWDGSQMHQARAIEKNVHGNLFTDTSSARSIGARLLEHYVDAVGADKILFGTDSPCYFSPAQRARVDCADIPDEAKLAILYENGLRIFPRLAPFYESACAALKAE